MLSFNHIVNHMQFLMKFLKSALLMSHLNDNNKKLLNIIEELMNRVDEICQRFGYVLEKDIIHNVLGYMDIKNVLKKAREA